jgi:hypothetical protein
MKKVIMLAALVSMSAAGYAQQADCTKFADEVESGLKAMSVGYISTGRGVDNMMIAVVNAANIQSNLMLMQSNKCKLPVAPITPLAYSKNALECDSAAGDDRTSRAEKCDRSKWIRSK